MERSTASPNHEPLLRAERIVKQYPGTTALRGVDFTIYAGAVNVLIGENGAGKSTLMKILAGVERPTEGRMIIRGEPVDIDSPRAARALGIGIIFQELSLFPNLSVSENIFIAREIVSRAGVVQQGQQEAGAQRLMERLQQPIDPQTLVEDLRVGQQQLVEIARALSEDVSILIMDEPTSALSNADTDVLLGIVRDLTAQGVAIVYISHKLDECLAIGDYFTVLRDGNWIAEAPARDVSLAWIVEKMSGRQPEAHRPPRQRPPAEPLLRVDRLSLPRAHGDGYLVEEVSLTVHAGEIVGIYGLLGAGRTELLECLIGLQTPSEGTVLLEDRPVESLGIDARIGAGLALVPEDRQQLGLVQNLSVAENITLASLARFVRNGALSSQLEQREVDRLVAQLGIKTADIGQPVTTLSGGNQQKVVMAKNLLTGPRVLMLDEPTRGIDVGARAEIFRMIRDLADSGMGILFVSSELNEIVSLADRALVMARGRLVATFSGDAITEQRLADASVAVPTSLPRDHER